MFVTCWVDCSHGTALPSAVTLLVVPVGRAALATRSRAACLNACDRQPLPAYARGACVILNSEVGGAVGALFKPLNRIH